MKIKESLVWTQKAPQTWYERIDNYLMGMEFSRNDVDPNLHFKIIKGDMLILIMHVDDFLITGEDHLIVQCKKDLGS